MKNIKLIVFISAAASILTFSACSSNRTKTQEVAPVSSTEVTPAPVAQVNTAPTYTVANLGASSAGRSK